MKELYLFFLLGNIKDVSGISSLTLGLVFSVYFIFLLLTYDEKENFFRLPKKVQKWAGIAFITSAILFIFTPSKKELLMIYGGGTILEYIQNNKEVKKIPDNVVKALNKWLEEEINEE